MRAFVEASRLSSPALPRHEEERDGLARRGALARATLATALFVLGPLGCVRTPDEPADPGLDELCGVEGPVRLLDVPPGSSPGYTPITRMGDRVVIQVADELSSTQEQIWVVGLCGGEARLLATLNADVWAYPGRTDALLGRDLETGDVLVFDLVGNTPPRSLQSTYPARQVVLLGDDLLHVLGDGTEGPLLATQLPADPWKEDATSVELLPSVRVEHVLSDSEYPPAYVTWLWPDVSSATPSPFAFVVDGDDRLVRIDLSESTTQVVAGDVRSFSPSPNWQVDGGFVLQGMQALGEDKYGQIEGPLRFVRWTPEEGVLAEHDFGSGTAATTDYWSLWRRGIVAEWVEPPQGDATAVFHRLDPWEVVEPIKPEVLAAFEIRTPMDERLVLLQHREMPHEFAVYDLDEHVLTSVWPGEVGDAIAHFAPDTLLVDSPSQNKMFELNPRGHARLRASMSLASDGDRWVRLANGEILSLPDSSSRPSSFYRHGASLWRVPPGSTLPRIVASNVWEFRIDWESFDDTGVDLFYRSASDFPARRGIWRVRLNADVETF